jgi:predicted ATPase
VEWEAHGRIDLFTLGSHDTSARLLIPEKLHGRESEVSRLHAAFDRVLTSGRSELVLLSGYSGIGKSSVVNELRKALVPGRGLFASGKFDQYKRDIPYATLCQALRSLVLRFLGKSDTELANWRTQLQAAVGGHGQLIVNLIPEAELIIGKQPPIADLARNDTETRFRGVLRRFLGALAQQGHPLVLFLDDLQWTDSATLVLLEYLLMEPGVQHLLLIGAYRNNEVNPTHPLLRTLKVFREAEIAMDEIVLAPLDLDDTDRLVADTLHCTPERAGPLAGLIYEKTAGNPFFAMQFINALAEESLILYTPEIAAWSWDLERVRAKSLTDNVIDLMISKLNRLSVTTREVLKKLACLGSSAETRTLGMVHQVTVEEIHSAFREAVNIGLVSRRDNAYAFLHDRIQEAAYALIPEDERAPTHLRIGRLLAENTPVEKREENIFEIVNQLNYGVELITSPQERELVAGLNLIAGNRAKTATAYGSSLVYVSTGMVLLGEDCWQRHNALMFAMELSRAECEFLIGETAAAEERLSTLAAHALALVDRAAVTRLRVALYTTLDRSDCAIEVGLEYLQSIGIEWSPHPTDEEVRWECDRMWHLLGSRPIEELIDLSLMNDPDWRATMDVLVEIAPPARFTGGNLHHLLLLRMTNLSLEHGNCDGSCYAYACLTIVLGHRFNDYQTGFRFGKLGVDLVDRRGLDRFKARVYMCFGLLMPWTKHAPKPLRAACYMGRELPREFRKPRFARCCRDRASGTPRVGRNEPLRGGYSAGARAGFHPERGPCQRTRFMVQYWAWLPNKLSCLSAKRAAVLSSLGRRWQSAATRPASPAPPGRTDGARFPVHDRVARRTPGSRDGR